MTTTMANEYIINDKFYGEINEGEVEDIYEGEFKDTRSIRQGWYYKKDRSSDMWAAKQKNPEFFSATKSWKRFDRRKEEKGSCKRRTYKLF